MTEERRLTRGDIEAVRHDLLAKHEQSLIDAAEFGERAGAGGRWKVRAEGVDAVLTMFDALPTPEAEGLDASWAEAEAALPEGWRPPNVGPKDGDDGYAAWSTTPAFYEGENDDESQQAHAYADSPAAALRALAARLRETWS